MNENTQPKDQSSDAPETVNNQITDAVTQAKPEVAQFKNAESKKQPLPETAFIEDTQVSNTKIYVNANVISHVVTGGDYDDVSLTRCVYENRIHKKSLTVHHLQRRLVELGYPIAGGDVDGYYSEQTQMAVDQFRVDNKIKTDGPVDEETFRAIFKGDRNVRVVI